MEYKFKDVVEFQVMYPTKEEKEEALSKLDDREIWHIAKTCTNPTARAWYSSRMHDKSYRGE